MHRMIAAERQPGNHRLTGTLGDQRGAGGSITHDLVVDLGINRSLVKSDARAARSTRLNGFAEALNYVRLARSCLILQGHQKAACMRFVIVVIFPRPSVDVNRSARRHHQVASVTNAIGKDTPAEARRQSDTDVLTVAASR